MVKSSGYRWPEGKPISVGGKNKPCYSGFGIRGKFNGIEDGQDSFPGRGPSGLRRSVT